MNEKDEIRFGFSKDESEQEFDLEDILKEFAPEDEELQEATAEVQPEETPEEPVEPQTEEVPAEESETVPEEVTAEEPEVPAEEVTPVAGDTVRLDDVAQALAEKMNAVLSADLQQMSEASLRKIRPYTLENMAKTHAEIFESGR